jgi:hypothetical protein
MLLGIIERDRTGAVVTRRRERAEIEQVLAKRPMRLELVGNTMLPFSQ